MDIVQYDGSFEGLFTAFFEIYEYKIISPKIYKNAEAESSLFGEIHLVITDKDKSKRVLDKLRQKLSHKAFAQLHPTFLSEEKDIENVLFRFVKYVIETNGWGENNLGNADVLKVRQTDRKVHREKHRMEAFVRFEKTKDELYYAFIQPDFNVLPLISDHFEKRYADQKWMIYDSLRKYGLYYNLETVDEVSMAFSIDHNDKNFLHEIYDEKEELYQKLWQQYFSNVNIAARKNMKLHIQHMPKRYWKNLVEKKKDL